MNEADQNRLTPEGEARREAMLDELVEVMSRTHRARRVRRRTLAIVGCAALLFVIGRVTLPWAAPSQSAVPRFVEDAPTRSSTHHNAPLTRPSSMITIRVHTDYTILERCRAAPTGTVVRMDDATLIETLAAIHRPAGLIRFGERVALSAPVTDAELGIGRN